MDKASEAVVDGCLSIRWDFADPHLKDLDGLPTCPRAEGPGLGIDVDGMLGRDGREGNVWILAVADMISLHRFGRKTSTSIRYKLWPMDRVTVSSVSVR